MDTMPAEVTSALRELYDELARELDPLRRPCEATGRCCRFAQSEHMLFVTGVERAYMNAAGKSLNEDLLKAGHCPFLDGPLCGIREHRALGCRIFFCDRTFEEERNALYERFLIRIREIEVRFGLSHSYVPVTKAFACEDAAVDPDEK